MTPGKGFPARGNLEWNDDEVLPAVLSLDTEYVFQRMTEETLHATQSRNGHRILDIGCGRGIDAVSLAQRGGILFGCEPSRIMIGKAKEFIKSSGEGVWLVRGLAEDLPFRKNAFERVVCKGAIDHFGNPDMALAEMCRVVARQGKVIISVANFESLSCAWARKLNMISQRLFGREIPRPHIWEVPIDHSFKFDYRSITRLSQRYLQIENVRGASLFWGFPQWSRFLQIVPRVFAFMLLQVFDRIASRFPWWGDVLILRGKPLRNDSERDGSQKGAQHMADTSRLWGALLCAAILVVGVVFLRGILIQSYWALAIPVMLGFLGILALAFWVGWTILTIKTTPPVPDPPEEPAAEKE